jgi:hypothetical protein
LIREEVGFLLNVMEGRGMGEKFVVTKSRVFCITILPYRAIRLLF